MKQDAITILDRQQIHNEIERGEFEPLILHSPEIEIKHFLDINSITQKEFMFIRTGQDYNIAITTQKAILYWRNSISQEKPDLMTSEGLRRKSLLGESQNLLQKSIDIFSQFSSKKDREKLTGIKNLYCNKKGDFALIVFEKAIVAFLPELNDLHIIDKNMREEITCVSFIEEFSQDQTISGYSFFIGTVRGSLRYGKVLVKDKTKKSENYVISSIKKVHDFHINKHQRSIINGVDPFTVDETNYLLLSVDKKLILYKDFASFENFANHFEMIEKHSKLLFESDFMSNKMYTHGGYLNYAYNVFIVNNNGIFMITINLKTISTIIDELPVFVDYGKEERGLIGNSCEFFPYTFHYALVFEKDLIVISMLSKDVVFKFDYEHRKFISSTKNMNNNNLILAFKDELIELKIINDMVNSWIHLVNQDLVELAYNTCLNYDPNYKNKVGKILAHKCFKEKEYTQAVEYLFSSKEDFELVISKINQIDNNSNAYYKNMVIYLKLKIEELVNKREERQSRSKLQILTVVLMEILSYKYVQTKRLVEMKQEREDINQNIDVNQADLDFYETSLTELIDNYKDTINKDVLTEILQHHGNFKFCEYYAVKQENYYDLIYDALNIDNFTKGLEVITKYYHHILKLKDNQFELHSNTLSEVLEKWGEDIFRARSKEFTGFIEEIFKTNGLKLFSESFFRKSLSFLNKRYDNEFIKPFLNYLVS